MYEYESIRRVVYNDEIAGDAVFVPVCDKCGRFVKADTYIKINEITGLSREPNATCSKCGRINMIFEGFI